MEAILQEPYVVENSSNTLHLTYGSEDDDNYIYPEIAIPDAIEIYISDLSCKKLITHSNLKVLDLDPTVNTDLDITSLSNLNNIIIRNTNIINKSLMELFPKNSRYRYSQCSLNGIPISKLVNELYKKYFGEYPKYETVHGVFPQIQNNIISYRIHTKKVIENIQEYEENIEKGRMFCKLIQDELLMKALHPDRFDYLISLGYDFEEIVDQF